MRLELAQDVFRIPRKVADHIYRLACAETPQEACGMLGGLGSKVSKVYPTKNMSTNFVTYEVDPVEAFEVIRQIRADGLEFIASWHSHPANAAFPSIVDVNKAADDTLVYVIVSLLEGEGDIRAFHIKDGWIKELEVFIDNGLGFPKRGYEDIRTS